MLLQHIEFFAQKRVKTRRVGPLLKDVDCRAYKDSEHREDIDGYRASEESRNSSTYVIVKS